MAIPSLANIILYTDTPLDDIDWLNNWTQVVNWFIDGTANITVSSITGMANLKPLTLAQIYALSNMVEGSVVMNKESHRPMFYDGQTWQTL
jgi:hypothetical protein